MLRAWILVVAMLCLGSLASADHQQPVGQGGRVEIYDHGFQVPIYSFQLPSGWRLNQQVATDVNNVWRMYTSYVVDFFGPAGEVNSYLFPVAVYPSQGQNWEQVWQELFYERVGPSGTFQLSPKIRSPLAHVLFPQSINIPGVGIFERSILGTLHGKQVEGKLFATIVDTGFSVVMYPSFILCSKGQLSRTIETLRQINATQREDPQYRTRGQQIMAQRLNQQKAYMQSRRDWFNSYMESMRETSEMRSQNAREFSAYLRSGGSGSRDSSYTTNDQFTDYLRDTTTFNDPYTGQQVSRQGQYDYWYTDNLVRIHGTNDPNFDPSTLNGDWTRIMPLEP